MKIQPERLTKSLLTVKKKNNYPLLSQLCHLTIKSHHGRTLTANKVTKLVLYQESAIQDGEFGRK